MDWSKDTDFEVILTNKAKTQAQKILDYIFFELGNVQAAHSIEQDMRNTARRLSYIAGSLKLCDDPQLKAFIGRFIWRSISIFYCIRLLMFVYILLAFIMICRIMRML